MTRVFANVIFHAFEAAYVSLFLLAPFVLLVEALILSRFNPTASRRAVLLSTLGMNLTSYVVGILLAPWLFVGSGLEQYQGVVDRGPHWYSLARESFVQAGIISVAVEVLALLPFRKAAGLDRILEPVVLGNLVSYLTLFVGFTMLMER